MLCAHRRPRLRIYFRQIPPHGLAPSSPSQFLNHIQSLSGHTLGVIVHQKQSATDNKLQSSVRLRADAVPGLRSPASNSIRFGAARALIINTGCGLWNAFLHYVCSNNFSQTSG
jgi:hypothetical protein